MGRKTYRTLAYIFFGLFFVTFVTLILLYAFNKMSSTPHLTIILLITSILSLFVASAFLVLFVNKQTLLNMLREENEYNIGVRSGFNNLSTFISRATILRNSRFNRKKQKYVIALTASNRNAMRNYQRNDSIIKLNAKLAQIIKETINERLALHTRNKYCYGLNKGAFYIFTVGCDEPMVRELIETLRGKIYAASEETNYRIWIEPIFGVVEVLPGRFIGEYVDDAIIARNASERNFESVTFYRDNLRRSVDKNDTDDIIEGLANNEFVVYYQPKFDLNKKEFTSSEALVRWNSKKHGLLPPAKFINAAENAGLIHEIDEFVFKRVCEDLHDAKRKGRRLLPVSVNFSLYEFFSTKFLDDVLNYLKEYDVDPSLLQIEITETTSMANQFLSVSIIKKLREKGIKILMDDFGVGFSNIGNLRKMPFDAIKIDKSFIDNIDTDHKAADIVKFLINVCKINGLEVIAEGVDNPAQVEVLKKAKCDTIQGYFYSKPIPKNEYEKFLKNNPFEVKKGDRR